VSRLVDSQLVRVGQGNRPRVRFTVDGAPDPTAEACRLAVTLVPHVAGASMIRTWSGIEGRFPDDIPVVGPSTSTDRLFHAFGFCGHGFQLGPAIGAILAEFVAEGRSKTPIAAFSPGRFADEGGSLRTAAHVTTDRGPLHAASAGPSANWDPSPEIAPGSRRSQTQTSFQTLVHQSAS
jgi:hypothetical protein